LFAVLKIGVLFTQHIMESPLLKDMMVYRLLRLNHNVLNMDIVMYEKGYGNYLDYIGGTSTSSLKDAKEGKDNKDNKESKEKEQSYNQYKPKIVSLEQSEISVQRENLRKIDIGLSQDEKFLELKDKNVELVQLGNYHIHCQWLDYANEIFNFGYIECAKQYAEEVIFHCRVLKDKHTYIKSSVLLVKILFTEGKFRSFSPKESSKPPLS